ncbi:MAG: metallophosphoesterase family protein [Actinomycetota bacterium]|nr:metallophosphoesterase family protein [Actinomycetota bacterium]
MLAILYDIHGNLPALEPVLADAEAAGAERYLLGGDYALFGAWPEETVERLRELGDAVWIRGNVDRWTAAPDAAPDADLIQRSIEWCADRLGDDAVRALAALPEQAILDGTRWCHASPVSDVKSFRPDPDRELDGLESQVGDDEQLGAGVAEPRLVFGHTHHAFRRPGPGGVELVNPGSVGLPWDGDPRAGWALLREDGTLELRRLEYDHEAAAEAVRERLGDWAETTARRLEAARFEP